MLLFVVCFTFVFVVLFLQIKPSTMSKLDILDFMLLERDKIRKSHFLVVEGDILKTPARHIAFAVNFETSEGKSGINTGGFAGQVAGFIPEVGNFQYEKGKPQTFSFGNKFYHALPVHSNEEGGWDQSPELITHCLNQLDVEDDEVIATVLIGGGVSGDIFNASSRNIAGMLLSDKTLALYLLDKPEVYESLQKISYLFSTEKKKMRELFSEEHLLLVD